MRWRRSGAFAFVVGGRPPLDGGSVLLEILVSLVLLGVILGPLVQSLLAVVDRAAAVQRGTSDLAQALGNGTAWSWGPGVESSRWRAGPVLEVRAGFKWGSDVMVGLWLDGWFQGEACPGASGELILKADEFARRAGAEVVLRVRTSGGEWGPPWRSIVPDSYGGLPATAKVTPESVAGDEAWLDGSSVLHTACRANPVVQMSGGSAKVATDALGMPVFLEAAGTGREDAVVAGQQQSWLTEAGRALDVYF